MWRHIDRIRLVVYRRRHRLSNHLAHWLWADDFAHRRTNCIYCGAPEGATHSGCWRASLCLWVRGRYGLQRCALCDRLHRAESTRDRIYCRRLGGWVGWHETYRAFTDTNPTLGGWV